MPITSSALGAMPPSSIQTFVNYSYCIDHLLKEINVTLNLNLNLNWADPGFYLGPGGANDYARGARACTQITSAKPEPGGGGGGG